MFRIRLALAIAISFGFVLLLAAVLHWGSNQVAGQFHRSQSAYDAFVRYERLSQEAYRYFKQQLDRLTTGSPDADSGLETSKLRLFEAMQAVRDEVVKNPSSDADIEHKPAELERVANLTAFLDASEYRFNEIERLQKQGDRDFALRALSTFSNEEIDIKFQPMIDAAIQAERQKATKAKQELETLVQHSRRIAIAASAMAALFSLSSGLLLLRRFKKPINALMKGTHEIAAGNLDYRISLNTQDEFSYLASHFNKMAFELSLQQAKQREGSAELENRVAERTFELHQLNEKLKHMDTERRDFLADISHELRTPITVIRGEAEVTLRGANRNAEEYKDTLQRISELSIQLGKYVTDLLFLARIETANLQFEWDKLNLTELVSTSAEDVKVMAEENALSVSFDAPTDEIWVQGDKQRLRQVLFILGDNACRYSNPGGHISMALWQEEKRVYFSLTDQGIGIPADDLDHIFERHFRSDNARRSRNDGSGLGLPLARSILKAHGGRIDVNSVENLGSTFTVSLPLFSKDQHTTP